MVRRRLFCYALLLYVCIAPVQAQWDVPFSHHWRVRSYYNPAFTGDHALTSTTALYRYQWAAIENGPRNVVLTADMPFNIFNRRDGAGVTVYSGKIGTLRNTLLAARYSYIKKSGRGDLHIGLQVGVHDTQFDAGKMQLISDSLHSGRGSIKVPPLDKQIPDMNVGITWRSDNGYAGLSAMHITQPHFHTLSDSLITTDLQSDSLRSMIPRTYNFMAGYNILLFHPLEIEPMVWIVQESEQTRWVASVRMEYRNRISGGVSWRSDDGYTLFTGFHLEGMELGYAYDLHNKGVGKESRGSHELYFRYQLQAGDQKPGRQPQKSIRLL